ncbi:MAG: mandelate racemase [Rhodobacteraceae bacterium]|nr:mandelate racemase [Paracoccaceae bacterium]
MSESVNIARLDFWPVRIPLARPYHLSARYGTLTHSQAVILRITLENGVTGWGEGDPHAEFDGYSLQSTCAALAERGKKLIGLSVANWVEGKQGTRHHGTPSAAIDVACHDALGHARGVPVWQLLGEKRRDGIDALWPTSSGDAAEDLAVIGEYHARGFRTYMLKMGDRPVGDEITRTHEVLAAIPEGVQIMVDANQGWSRAQARDFVEGCNDLPLVLVEQPLPADDLEGLSDLRKASGLPISVDESILRFDQVGDILAAAAADVFSIKISKNGGLSNSLAIAKAVEKAGKRVLMNSMIELGITQAASLHLGVTLDQLMPCGHAYMSTLRMADDVTNFSNWVVKGRAELPDRPGLGVEVSMDKINEYKVGEYHVD